MDSSSLIPDLERYGAPLLAKLLSTVATIAGGPIVGGVVSFVLNALAGAIGAKSADPADIQAQIEADPAKAKAVLPQVEADHADLVRQALTQAEIDEANLENARATEAELARTGSWIAWGAPAVSVIAVAGFVVVACLVLLGHGGDGLGGQQILGAMTVGWTTVLTYWLGSSKGSADKTMALTTIAHAAVAGGAARAAKRER